MRIYSSAEEDITRAFHARLVALRAGGTPTAPTTRRVLSARTGARDSGVDAAAAGPARNPFPLPVVVAAAAAFVLVALASISRLVRRHTSGNGRPGS